jgi:membrane-associated phospholipid phosphatase
MTNHPVPQTRPPLRVIAGAASVAAGLCFLAVYLLADRTSRGQIFDLAGQIGPHQRNLSGFSLGTFPYERSVWLLRSVKSIFLAGAALAVGAAGIVSRRFRLTAAIGVASLTSMALARVIRNNLPLRALASGNGVHWLAANTLPSGHSTAAVAVAIAGVAVAWRGRWAVVIVGMAYAIGIGVATVIAGWHRPSDVIAANLLGGCLAFAALAVAAPEPARLTLSDLERRTLRASFGLLIAAAVSTAAVLLRVRPRNFNVELNDGFPVYNNFALGAKTAFLLFVFDTGATCQFLLATMAVLSRSISDPKPGPDQDPTARPEAFAVERAQTSQTFR